MKPFLKLTEKVDAYSVSVGAGGSPSSMRPDGDGRPSDACENCALPPESGPLLLRKVSKTISQSLMANVPSETVTTAARLPVAASRMNASATR